MNSNHIDKYKVIGQRIAYYRSQKGLTQQELADKIGISKSYLSKIESPNTVKPFSLDVLFSISESLNISVIDLMQNI
jgi:transcriptional regulator with XRE-family HTH domain